MRAFWSDPYLWIHLSGLAAVPLWLEACYVGLAIGEPQLPPTAELAIVAAVGVLPVLWMQWRAPFYIFSVLVAALRPHQLSEPQRRLLPFFKGWVPKLLSLAVATGLVALLWQLDRIAPLLTPTVVQWPLPHQRWFGLGTAAIAFLLVNLFAQVPVSVMRVMLVSDAAMAAASPYPPDKITQQFTLLGWRVDQLLPALTRGSPPSVDTADTAE